MMDDKTNLNPNEGATLMVPGNETNHNRKTPAEAAQDYVDAGFQTIPLRTKDKTPRAGLSGVMGKTGKTTPVLPRETENVGIRFPHGLVGIDVDDYTKTKDDGTVITKDGAHTLDLLIEKLGPLPETDTSGAREGRSRIYWFRVDPDLEFVGNLQIEGAGDIEVLQFKHRYAVVPPSIHPDLGTPYFWEHVNDDAPMWKNGPAGFPELPKAWQDYLMEKRRSAAKASSSKQAPIYTDIDEVLTEGGMDRAMERSRGQYELLLEQGSTHYDAMVRAQMSILNRSAKGHPGGKTAMESLYNEYMSYAGGVRAAAAEGEWKRGIDGGLSLVDPDAEFVEVSPGNVLFPAPGQWDAVAEQLSRKMIDEDGNRTLVRASGEWYVFADKRWMPVRDESVYNRIRDLMRFAVYEKRDADGNVTLVEWSMSLTNLSNIESALYRTQSIGSEELGAMLEVDVWIGKGPGSHTNDLMPLNNGLLDPVTRKLYPHSAGFFNLSIVEMDFDPNATETPSWDYLLESQWGKDSDSAQTLHEWIGYTLLGRVDLHKGLYIVGETRTGKGVIARTLQNMVGKSAYTSIRVEDMVARFGLSTAIGKKLITIAETERGAGRNEGFVVALKNAIGQDHTQIDRKNREPWVGPLGNFLVTSNFAPEFQDSSGAAQGRFIVLHTPTSFLGKEDPELESKIAAETPAILNKALDAYDALRSRKEFVQPDAPASLVESMSYTTPMEQFMGEYVVLDADAYVTREEFRSMYLLFCEDQGYAKPTSRSVTDQINRATGYKVETSSKIKVKNHEGKWVVGYKGMGLKIDTSSKKHAEGVFFATGSTLGEMLANAHNPGNTRIPDEAPKVVETPEPVKAPEKDVEPTVHETRTLTLDDGRKVVCDDLSGSWDTIRGQFRVTVYAADGSVAGSEHGSGAFLKQHRDVDVAAFTA